MTSIIRLGETINDIDLRISNIETKWSELGSVLKEIDDIYGEHAWEGKAATRSQAVGSLIKQYYDALSEAPTKLSTTFNDFNNNADDFETNSTLCNKLI